MELDMTKGSPFRLIVKFIIPIILGNLFQQLYNLADTVIVGRFVGVQALAAVGATGTISFLILGFLQGLTTGFTVQTAQRFGAGDLEGMKKSVGNAAVLSVVVTVVMTAGSVLIMDWLLRIMQTPEDILEMSKTYILIICWGMGFSVLYNLLSSILRAVGNSKVPLFFLILSAAINVIGDLVLIINFDMGVAGAALATVASQAISGVLCLIYMIKKVPLLSLQKEHFRLDRWCVRNQVSVGIPMALQFSITAVGTIMVQVALNLLGSTVVASYTAACKVEQLVTQVFVALGMTMATYCGQNRGMNDLDRIKKGSRIAFWMSSVYGVVIYIVVQVALPWIIQLFVSENVTEVLGYARIYIMINGAFFIPLGMIYIYRNVMQSCGYGLMPMMGGVVELVSRAILAVIAASLRSYEGVCLANASAWCLGGIFLYITYRFTMKKMEREKRMEEERMAALG